MIICNGLARPLAAMLLLTPTLSFAQDNMPVNNLSWVASIGITFGGEDLASAEIDDSDYTDDVEAGGLLYLGGGINYRFGETPFSLQGVYGYHFDYVDADNGDASFGRAEFDFIGAYQFGRHRLGLGVTQHFSAEYEIDTDQESRTDEFDDATGMILEYTYMASPHVGVSVRYTDIEYDCADADCERYYSKAIDGSNVGLFIHGYF